MGHNANRIVTLQDVANHIALKGQEERVKRLQAGIPDDELVDFVGGSTDA